jgi:hypothetical protein
MKTLKISMLALLFTVGIGGAVVQKIQAAPKNDVQEYSWTSPNQGTFSGTRDEAIDHYGCETGTKLCATGTAPGVPNSVLNKN